MKKSEETFLTDMKGLESETDSEKQQQASISDQQRYTVNINSLPSEILFKILGYLTDIKDIALSGLVCKTFNQLLNIHCKRQFTQLFPHVTAKINDQSAIQWYDQLLKTYAVEYEGLSPASIRFFDAVKNDDISCVRALLQQIEIAKTEDVSAVNSDGNRLKCEDLLVMDKNGFTPLDWAKRKHYQDLLNYVFRFLLEQYFLVEQSIDIDKTDPEGRTILFWAINCYQPDSIIKAIINEKSNVSAKFTNWFAVKAAYMGYCEFFNLLLTVGADVNVHDGSGFTPLHMAAQQGHHQIVDVLLAAGAKVNATDSKSATPLYVAALEGHCQVVDTLLAAGAEINAPNSNGVTPLYIAAQEGDYHIVSMLLAKGAEVNTARNTGTTPLFIAAQAGHHQIVNVLLARGAEVNKARNSGATPLFIATQEGHLEIVNALLAAGAKVNATDSEGDTPLYVAAQKGHCQVVDTLLAAGAEINTSNSNGVTPLYIAAQEGDHHLVSVFLAKGAEVNTADNTGTTPLFIAAQEGHHQIVNVLLARGAEVNRARDSGATPLYIAALEGNLEIVNTLLAAGAKVNAACEDGATPLYIAALKGQSQLINTLLAAGAKVDAAKDDGLTPLFIAAEAGHQKIVNTLLACGANVNVSVKGATPLFVAAQNGHLIVVEMLLNNHANPSAVFVTDVEDLRNFTKDYDDSVKSRMNYFIQKGLSQQSWLFSLPSFISRKISIKISPIEIAEIMGYPEIVQSIRKAKDTFLCSETSVEVVESVKLN